MSLSRANLDEWAEVEKQIKDAPAGSNEKKDSKQADPKLISKLLEQIEDLSL